MTESTSIHSPSSVGPDKRRTYGKWVVLAIGIFFLVILATFGFMAFRMTSVPKDLDFSTGLRTDQGLYQVSYTAELNPMRINQIHSWRLHVEFADGQPVEGAQISVDGDMPQHGHGLPTRPQVTEYLGNGDYLVEGLKFHMPGWWIVEFTINANGESDHVTFNLMLK